MAYPQKVSVIVPVYNAETTVEECVRSLLELNYPKENLEIIFVDNASTDNTLNTLNMYSEAIRILSERKRGSAAARNKGLSSAKGDVIAFVDADCVVDKDWLENVTLPLRDDSVGVVGGKILSKRPYNKIEEFGEEIHDHNVAINECKPPYAITMNWASRLSVIKEAGLFDEGFARSQDVDLSWRIFRAGYRLVYESRAVVYHENERTLLGLFDEGYVHGFHSIKLLKAHHDFLKKFGYRRFNVNSYKRILSSLIHFILGRSRSHSLCYFVFNSGKKLGKLIGSVRYFYLNL